jgi:hypothetical protein
MVEKDRLETLYNKHTFTMFIGLLMFGVYCTIMIIVLINMLIAMMSNSYEIIAVNNFNFFSYFYTIFISALVLNRIKLMRNGK